MHKNPKKIIFLLVNIILLKCVKKIIGEGFAGI